MKLYPAGQGIEQQKPRVSQQYNASPYCVRMRGLPYNTTDQDITNFFTQGQVSPARIHRKADGTEAFCEFRTEEDLRNAMSRNKAFLGPRYVEIFQTDYNVMAERVGLPRIPEYANFQLSQKVFTRTYER